jgi:periplasmic divalent cation tolerance protein
VDTLLVLTTCPDDEHAESLSISLIEQGLAGCINRVPGISSVYRWEGALKSGTEVLLLIKTAAGTWPALEAEILRQHPYELPEIIAVPISRGHQRYLDWIVASST